MTAISNLPHPNRSRRLLLAWRYYFGITNAIQPQLTNDNPPYNGGEWRCFPETSALGGTHNYIFTSVILTHAIPTNLTGTVFIDWFDPNNPAYPTSSQNQGPGKRDNHGEFEIDNTTLTFAGGARLKWTTCTISPAHAGDNYIIAAHPNAGVIERAEIDEFNNIAVPVTVSGGSGGSSSGGSGGTSYHNLKKSDMLTVWRTLWAELDRMALPPNDIVKADLPLIDGFVATALAEACIVIKPYTPNPTVWVSGLEVMPVDKDWNGSTQSIAAACRNSPQPSNTFWTVHMIGAFRGEKEPATPQNPSPVHPFGRWYSHNTIFIFNWEIENHVDSWNNNSGPNSQLPLGIVQRWVSLHELGHALWLSHGSGIMAKSPPPPDEFLDALEYGFDSFWKFNSSQIQIIQSKPKPR